jgi:hypothetical protein
MTNVARFEGKDGLIYCLPHRLREQLVELMVKCDITLEEVLAFECLSNFVNRARRVAPRRLNEKEKGYRSKLGPIPPEHFDNDPAPMDKLAKGTTQFMTGSTNGSKSTRTRWMKPSCRHGSAK